MKNIKVILFDHDDTLVDTYGTKSAEHIYIAKKYYGRDITEIDIKREWGKSLSTVLKNLYQTDDIEQATEYNKQLHLKYPKVIFDATAKTLSELKSMGYKLGTVTSTIKFSHDHDLETLDFPEGIFEYKQTQEDTDVHKPDPKVFDLVKIWLKDQGLKPEQVLYVGDGMHDFKAASGAGFHFVGVDTGPSEGKDFIKNNVKSVPHIGHLISDILL
jgi:phosphoglycolate phosphatase